MCALHVAAVCALRVAAVCALRVLFELAGPVLFPDCLSVPATIYFTFKENSSGKEVNAQLEMPYILTPKPGKAPRINGASVFGVRPWSPFQYLVAATGEPPLAYSAEGLPEGLRIHADNGLITGAISKKGEYKVKLKVTNSFGRDDTAQVSNTVHHARLRL